VPALTLVTAAERPELAEAMLSLGASPWPEFLDHDAVVEALWRYLYELAPDYQFALLDEKSESLVAIGNCIPIRWDGDPHTLPDRGVDAVLEDGVACLREGATATAASALMIVVSPERLGQGISGEAIRAMADVVGRHSVSELVAPVRPTDKHRYPLIPIEGYIRWRRPDGLSLDPWTGCTSGSGARSSGPPRLRCASPAASPNGSAGRGSRCRRAAHTSFQVRSCPSRSTASATSASTRSRRAGCATAFRAAESNAAERPGQSTRRAAVLAQASPLPVDRRTTPPTATGRTAARNMPQRPPAAMFRAPCPTQQGCRCGAPLDESVSASRDDADHRYGRRATVWVVGPRRFCVA
jgi:hypothetical protein